MWKSDIPSDLVNNAYASLILPRLKRLKYDHDKIVKPKPDIYINIKSDEVDDYYNLPNKIDLNGPYQAALYKMDIENTLDEYMGYVSYVNLDNDNKFFNLIKSEMTEVSTNKVNYTLKKGATNINANIKTKQDKIIDLFSKLESSYYKNQVKVEYQKIKSIVTITLPNTPDSINIEKISVKFDDLELLKSKFNYQLNDSTITFSSKLNNHLLDFEQNNIPHWEIKFLKGTDITTNKLEVKYYPKINLIQPIYCDIIRNNVSNNNVIAYVNFKNKYLSEPLDTLENISYFKVTQSNINRIKISFTDELNKLLKLFKIKYFLTVHLKPI